MNKHEHWTSVYTAELGRQIAVRRAARGWSQKDLAEAAGVRQHLITGLESGRSGPHLTTAYRLAETLGVSLPLLLIDVEAALQDAEAAA